MAGIAIIGAGECGVRAAFTLRDEGYDGAVTLLSAEDAVPYERPPLSKTIPVEARPIRPAEAYAAARIDLRLGVTVESIEPQAHLVRLGDGTTLSYDKLLIATGARARLFPSLTGCMTLRTLEDAKALLPRLGRRTRIGIIGGGFIGLELAATARQAGAEVTVIETAPRLMARALPELIASLVEARHRAEGVVVRTGVRVSAANAASITLDTGETLEFDIVVAGVGATPETGLAQAAGLAVDDGIIVDAAFRTSAPDIHAAGDCCRFPWMGRHIRLESWRVAQDQGGHAAKALLGSEAGFDRHPWFWSDQYDLTLQVAGLFDPSQKVIHRPISEDASLVFQLDDSGQLVAAAGVGPGNTVARDIKLAERLIERGVRTRAEALADPGVNLKQLLKAA